MPLSTLRNMKTVAQLGISLPIVFLMLNEIVFLFAMLYSNKEAQHNVARDFLFICGIVICIRMLFDTWFKTMLILSEEKASDGVTIVCLTPPTSATSKATAASATATSEATSATATPEMTSAHTFVKEQAPSSPIPCKAPATPPTVDESAGPSEEKR